MSGKTESDSRSDIQIMEGKDAVRKRPGMFLGTPRYAVEHVCRELSANVIDQFLAGRATTLTVEIDEHRIIVGDDGPGLPIVNAHGQLDDRILTTLHFDATSDGHAPHVHISSHGVGLAPLNFLADRMEIRSWIGTHDRRQWCLSYEKGERSDVSSIDGHDCGTVIEWYPDLEIIGPIETRLSAVRQELWEATHLFSGLTIRFNDELFLSDHGLLDLAWINRKPTDWQHDSRPLHFCEIVEDVKIEVAAIGRTDADTRTMGWVNGNRTSDGSHIVGLHAGLTHPYELALIHVVMLDPQYAGPTKGKLDVPFIAEIVENTVKRFERDSTNR